MIQNARASDPLIGPQPSPENRAFARYIASLQQREPFTESEPLAVFIQASLPELYKEAEVLAIRETGGNERSQYFNLGAEGDGAVREEVIARYFALQRQEEDLPLSSILITPANYKFRLRGSVKTGDRLAYVYDIAPKRRLPGMIKGQLWLDGDTGSELIAKGRMTDASSIGVDIDMLRETKLLDGFGYARVIHLSFVLPLLGRSELVITEFPLCSLGILGCAESGSPAPSGGGNGRR